MEKNDLLRKFKETTEQQQQQQQQQPGIESRKEQEGELNLGLSLGGCFGVKPKNETSSSLFRSASTSEACLTAAFMKEEVEDVPLTRTSSLPSETLDSRKRKGIPSMEQLDSKKRVGGGEAWSFKPNWGFSGQGNPLLRASHGSQGSGSSTNSFLESPSAQGSSNHRGPRSPASVLPLPEQMEQKPTVMSFSENAKPDVATGSEKVNSLERPDAMRNCTKESEAKVMEDMPCVFTKGVGPNGKRIEGLLFKYKKGEDLRIVCVCHGTFLTPAEFVKHAGGGEVAHPLRHIVVAAPSLSSFS